MDGLRHFIAAAAILDRKDEDRAEDQHRHHDAHHSQVDIQVVDVDRRPRKRLQAKVEAA